MRTATLGPLTGLPAGPRVIEADYSGTASLAPASRQDHVTVAPAATSASVHVSATRLTATVAALPPGGGTPAGRVTFTVAGTTVGSARLNSSGVATLAFPAKITCTATETPSGLTGPCALTVHRTQTAITWTATATSNASVTATVTGKAHLTDFYVVGVTLTNGRYPVTNGKSFTIRAYVIGATKTRSTCSPPGKASSQPSSGR